MRVWMFTSTLQVEDNAPANHDEIGILYEEYCKVADIVYMMPTVSLNIEDVKISKNGSIELKEIGERMYEITGKVIDGYFHFGYCDTNFIYLVIDVGFLLRVSIDMPNKHLKIKTECGYRCVPLVLTEEDRPRTIRISKGDFITFKSKIHAMWTDMWGGAVYVSFKGKIVDREIMKDHSMWLLVEVLPHEKEYELDSYYSKHPLSQRLSDGDIVVEYPSSKDYNL